MRVVPLGPNFFEEARIRAKPFECTQEHRDFYRESQGDFAVHKHCDYENHLYYQVGVLMKPMGYFRSGR